MARYLRHEACTNPGCGSSDAMAVYSDGSTYCWSCKKATRNREDEDDEMNVPATVESVAALATGALVQRGISAETAATFGVKLEYDLTTGTASKAYYPLVREDLQIAGYQGKVLRDGPRQKGDVFRVGNTKKGSGILPFGAHVAGLRGNMIVVTEGAEDCLAAHEMFLMTSTNGRGYRCVSVLGTDGWQDKLDYFASWEKVVICFDQDPAGIEAARAFSDALKPGQAVVMKWDEALGDANQLLKDGRATQFRNCLNGAKPYVPTGIVWGDAVWERMEHYVEPKFVPYPPEWEQLNKKMRGLREAEISLWTAGSSIGKTSFLRRVKQHIITDTHWKVGEIELEEKLEKTARGMYQWVLGKPWATATIEERRRAHELTYGSGRLFAVDRGLRGDKQSLLGQFKALHYSFGANIIFLDHITLGVREWGGSGELDKQDQMMEDILRFVEQTGVHVALVSHLRKPPGGGKSWSEGAVPTEEDMKGSGSLYQIAFDIIAMSRNKQHEDEYQRNVTQLHVTKCRETGNTGPADRLYWNPETLSLEQAMEYDEDGGRGDTGEDRPF